MTQPTKVVAGYDSSAESKLAVEWAAAVANRRGRPLRIVSATGVDPTNVAAYRAGVAVGSRQSAHDEAQEGAARARAAVPGIDVEAKGVEQGSVAALVEESKGAELLVVGNRGRGRLRGALLGSSAFSVAIHAECPVAVVRGSLRPLPSPKYPIVVATDGSPYSRAAVLEAGRLASETDATLKIVTAYDAPSGAMWLVADYPDGLADGPDADEWDAAGEIDPDLDGTGIQQRRAAAAGYVKRAAQAVAAAHPDVRIEVIVAPGRAERVILDVAENASLIAVGARGRGDFASLLLGSVSRDVIQHADCTVYVVR